MLSFDERWLKIPRESTKEKVCCFLPAEPVVQRLPLGYYICICVYLTGFSIFTPAKRRLSAVVSGYGAAEGNSAFLYLLITVRRAKAARAL